MRFLLSFLGLLFLSGCATDYCGTKTISGQCIGSAEFTKISIEESKLQASPDIRNRVTNLKARSLYNRYQEVIYFKSGVFTFDKALSGGFYDNFNENEFRQLVSEWTVYGQKIDGASFDIKRKDSVNYAFFDRPNKKCLFGKILFGETRELVGGSGHTGLLKGFICVPASNDSEAFLDEFVTDLNKVKLK